MLFQLEKIPNSNRYQNPLIKRKILSSYKNRITTLDYNFISFSSQDPTHPINSLVPTNINSKNEGWLSNRYCTYPQEIMINFPNGVNIRQINILINESKIPKKIEIINCIPVGKRNKVLINGDKKVKLVPSDFMYENIGFINFSSNAENNFKSRELRKVYININSEYLKLKIHQNYNNNLNMFCQVGIVALSFYGQKRELQKKRKISPQNEKNKTTDIDESNFDICFNGEGLDEKVVEEKLDTQTIEKIKELTKEMNIKKENELFNECKFIKEQIDKIKKISLKIFALTEEKKEFANKNEFEKAQEIKNDIEKVKKKLEFYSSNEYKYEENKFRKTKQNEKINNKNSNNKTTNKFFGINKNNQNINVSQSQQLDLNMEEFLDYDDIIVPSLKHKLKKNNLSLNQSFQFNGNSFDSLENTKEIEQQEPKPLEELSEIFKNKYQLLILIVGEEVIRKIFSKSMGYRKEGLQSLNKKIPEILNKESDTKEANKYLVLLMDIIYLFLRSKHASIVFEALDIFNNILKAINNKSKQNNINYDFTITKKILNKIKEKLNDISKLVREKAENLYYIMLDSDFCDYNTLLAELIEKELIYQFNKFLEFKKNNNNNEYSPYDEYNNYNIISEDKSSNHLIITKLNIFLKALENFDDSVRKNKTSKESFPQNLLGDFIIININHPNNEIREIAKKLLIRFIDIFGNSIIEKMNIYLDERDIMRLDKELKKTYKKIRKEENKNIDINKSNESLFLTNVNKKFPLKQKNKLPPIDMSKKNLPILEKHIVRSSSQPKFKLSKNKLAPIPEQKKPKILKGSNSQKSFNKIKKKK